MTTTPDIEAVLGWIAVGAPDSPMMRKSAREVIIDLQARVTEEERRSDMLDDCNARQFEAIATFRADLAACKAAVATMAVRLDHCADMIAESHAISGTLRAERTIKARHYALEARAIVEPDKQHEIPSARIKSDKDRENPVEGAHPKQPEDYVLVEELTKLAAKASPGPWHLISGAIGVNPWITSSNGTLGNGTYARGGCILNMVAHDQSHEDAALIILLRNNLDMIRKALAAIAKAGGVA